MKAVVVFTLMLLVAGCSSLKMRFNDHLFADFQQAIAQQNFKKAQLIATDVPVSHQDYTAIQHHLDALEQAEAAFAKQQATTAKQLAAQDQWQTAIDQINKALAQLPTPRAPLTSLRQQLLTKQHAITTHHITRLLTAKASLLLQQQEALQQLAKQAQDVPAQQQAQHLLQQQDTLAQRLIALGLTHANNANWHASQRCFSLARRLGATNVPTEAQHKAKQHLQQRHASQQAQQQQKQQSHAQMLVNAYEASHQLDDLLAARHYLAQHNKDGRLDTLEHHLRQAAQERFRQGMTKGDRLYTRGEYAQALQVWKQLKPLYPDNAELTKKLERVNQVLHSLDALEH